MKQKVSYLSRVSNRVTRTGHQIIVLIFGRIQGRSHFDRIFGILWHVLEQTITTGNFRGVDFVAKIGNCK